MWRIMPRLRPWCPLPSERPLRSISLARRSLFTDEFLRREEFDTRSRTTRLFVDDSHRFKANLRRKFDSTGLKDLSSEEIKAGVFLASSRDDTQWMGRIILALAETDIQFDCVTAHWFMLNCVLHQDLSTSRALWQSPAIQTARGHWFDFERKRFQVLHFTLLYRLGRFDELIADYKRFHQEPGTHIDCSVLAMAAWCRRGTRADFDEACQFYEKPPLNTRRAHDRNTLAMRRAQAIYIYFCVRVQEYNRAFDLLRVMPGNLDRNLNLQLQILTEAGQLEQAMFLLKSRVLVKGDKKPCICYPLVIDLVQRIKAEKDADKRAVMLSQMSDILQRLDQKAQVLDATVEDHFIMAPIGLPHSFRGNGREKHLRRGPRGRHRLGPLN